ncbi:MAG: (Fe-S)-binding protein [Rhodospirillaceae bacterium]|nr:(Fe-S)-binding protein [Rhodospirillaceae bacterium]
MAETKQNKEGGAPVRVALFVTCSVDLIRPSVGFAAVKLLEDAGCQVSVPAAQTCCGQPAYNGGDRGNARAIAEQVIAAFAGFDYVVAPSGSCAAMIQVHYPQLLDSEAARELASRTYELMQFLVDVRGMDGVAVQLDASVAYHDSCSGLRELGIKEQPRTLLASVDGLSQSDYQGSETCCGFGGLFCVKYPDIANKMAADRTQAIEASGADMLLGGDLGCLCHLAGKLSRDGSTVQVRHVAEVLAGMTDAPALCQGEAEK